MGVMLRVNKLSLIYDNTYRLNSHIQLGVNSTVIHLIVDNKLENKDYKVVYSIIDNHLVVIDGNDRRYIINNKGQKVKEWEIKDYNIDEIYIGEYIDSIGIQNKEETIKDINLGKQLFICTDKNMLDRVILTLYNSNIKGTYIFKLNNTYTLKEICSLIVNNKTEIKFVDGGEITHNINIITNRLRLISKSNMYNIENERYYGIYNRKKFLQATSEVHKITNNLIAISINNTELGLIYKNKLIDRRYNFIGDTSGVKIIHDNKTGENKFIKNNDRILFLQDAETDEYSLYNLYTFKRIGNIKNLKVTSKLNYMYDIKGFEYSIDGVEYTYDVSNSLYVEHNTQISKISEGDRYYE